MLRGLRADAQPLDLCGAGGRIVLEVLDGRGQLGDARVVDGQLGREPAFCRTRVVGGVAECRNLVLELAD